MNNLFNNNQTDIDYSNIKELVRNYQPLDVQYLLTHDKPINLEIKFDCLTTEDAEVTLRKRR